MKTKFIKIKFTIGPAIRICFRCQTFSYCAACRSNADGKDLDIKVPNRLQDFRYGKTKETVCSPKGEDE